MRSLNQRIIDIEANLARNNDFLEKLTSLLKQLKLNKDEEFEMRERMLLDITRHNNEIPALAEEIKQLSLRIERIK